MILLDFEKAYDRVEWPFVIGILTAFGFPYYFCKWIEIMFKDSSTVIEINGEFSKPIILQRSIRHGFPIAPSLIVIVVDTLFYILKDASLGHHVKGITLSNARELINAQFADDTTLFLELSKDNFYVALNELSFLCFIFGAKLAPHKSYVMGWKEMPPNWLSKMGWNWTRPNTITRYLGIPFSLESSFADMWEWVFSKINIKHIRW